LVVGSGSVAKSGLAFALQAFFFEKRARFMCGSARVATALIAQQMTLTASGHVCMTWMNEGEKGVVRWGCGGGVGTLTCR
jgi:hypothetical protein